MILTLLKASGYVVLWFIIAGGLHEVFGSGEEDETGFGIYQWISLAITFLFYLWRIGVIGFSSMGSRRLLSTSRLPAVSSPRSSSSSFVLPPDYIFENDAIPDSQVRRLRYEKRLWKATQKNYAGLLKIAPPKMLSTKPEDFFSRAEILEVLVNFKAKHMEDLHDEVKDGKLNWNNENCEMFFTLMEKKYKITQRDTITALFYLSHEVEYQNYYDAMQIKVPKSSQELIRQTVLYDIYREKSLSPDNVYRYGREVGVSISRWKNLGKAYEEAKESLKVEAFETNLRQDDKRRKESIEEQLRHVTREESFQIANEHNLIIDTEAYHISSQDYSRSSSLDRHYQKHFAFALTQAFGGLCCKCGEGMRQLEFDHFWLPKSEGGNFLMRSKQGYYVNNCIPLCRSCNASKGARSFLKYFAKIEVEKITEKSQSMNAYLNAHMADFEDLDFEDRLEV